MLLAKNEITLSIEDVARLERVNYSTVTRRINRGQYRTCEIPSAKNKGKIGTKIFLSSLPPKAIRVYSSRLTATRPSHEPRTIDDELKWFNLLPANHQQIVQERLSLIKLYKRGKPQTDIGEFNRFFCLQYKITERTFYRYLKKYEKFGILGLANKNFGQNRAKLSADQKQYIVELIKANPDRRATAIFQYILNDFPEPAVSESTVRRFMELWKKENHALYTMWLSPDEYKNRYQPAFGIEDEEATHFCHIWELDSSPADVICNDNKRYSLLGLIDLFSRKPKVKVAPTSNSVGIAAVLRLALLDWGVPDQVTIDNGQDYVSNHIDAVLNSLGVNIKILPPFTPEGKGTIERFFGTLTRSLLEETPGYIGHNVADRKKIESRKSFAERQSGKKAIHIGLSPFELQERIDSWLENIYSQKKHTGIEMSPDEKMAQTTVPVRTIENERALDILLLKAGNRFVQKKGIAFNGGQYQSLELAPYVKENVIVKLDMESAGVLYVFNQTGEFICLAYDRKLIEFTPEQLHSTIKSVRADIRKQSATFNRYPHLVADPMERVITNGKPKKIAPLVRREAAKLGSLDEAEKVLTGKSTALPPRGATAADIVKSLNGDLTKTDETETDPTAWLGEFEIIENGD